MGPCGAHPSNGLLKRLMKKIRLFEETNSHQKGASRLATSCRMIDCITVVFDVGITFSPRILERHCLEHHHLCSDINNKNARMVNRVRQEY